MLNRIIILGMLRSGTSLAAELVRVWGAYAGRAEELWSSEPGDPRGYGYMEYIPLQQLNDELLDHNDRVPLPVAQMAGKASDPKYRQQALALLQNMDRQAARQQAPAWVWKDARLPLTLPFWVNFWGDPVYVITVRHPAEAILSAARTEDLETDNLPFSAGLIYWQYNMLNILAFTRDSRRKIFIAYDQLTEHPLPECARLCRFLDEQCGADAANADRRIEALASRVEAGRRHYRYEKALAEMPQASREQRALYNFLRVKTLYPDEPFEAQDFALYPGWREYLQAMDMLLAASRKQAA